MVSIIIPVYKEAKLLDKFLLAMTKQTSKDFKITFTVDTNTDNVLEVIEKYKTLRKKIDVIYNSKRVGKATSIKYAIDKISTEYSLVISTSVLIGTTFIAKVNDLIKRGNSDIIEFNAKIKSPIKMKGKVRRIINKKVRIQSDPAILAYTYPLEFNKIIKTSVLQKTNKLKMSSVINSMFGAEHIYKTFLQAKTYSSFNEDVLTKTKSSDISKINLVKIIDQWEYINKHMQYNYGDDFKQEMEYAYFVHVNVFIIYIAHKMDSRVAKKRVSDRITQINATDLKDFYTTNKYLLSDASEAKILKKNMSPDKHYKNLKDIQAWI